jgi:quercetin dioxygenase-like cupin family protein
MPMRLEVIPWTAGEPPSDAPLRQRLEAEGYDVFRWSDGPDADYQPHAHDHDESIWLIEGEITFGAEGREWRLRPGDRLMLPAGTVHTARAGRAGATYLVAERR